MITHLSIRFKLFFIYSLVAIIIFSSGFTLYYILVKHHLEHQIETALTMSNKAITGLIDTAATVSLKAHLRAVAQKNLKSSNTFIKTPKDI